MREPRPAKLLRLHICESDRWRGKPLYEALVEKCREMHMAGATVYRGIEGYGHTAEIHRAHVLAHDRPIVVSIVDTAENIARLLPAAEEMMGNGLIAVSDVEMIRVQKSAPAGA